MPLEVQRVRDKLRDIIVENISEAKYDITDVDSSGNNNIFIEQPDVLYTKANSEVVFCVFTKKSKFIEVSNIHNQLHKLEEQDDGSFRVWIAKSVQTDDICVGLCCMTPKSLNNIGNELSTLLSGLNSIELFNVDDDGFYETADIQLEFTDTKESGEYPYRKDFHCMVNYVLFEETYLWPADIIDYDIEHVSEIEEDEEDDSSVDTELIITPIDSRTTNIEIRKI